MNLKLDFVLDDNFFNETKSGGRIINNGILDCIIQSAYITNSQTSKAKMLNLVIKKVEDENNTQANNQTIYNAFVLFKADGSPSEIGQQQLVKLAMVCNIDPSEMTHIQTTKQDIKDYAGNTITVDAIQQFTGRKFTGRFQQEYSQYNGKITDKVRLRNYFRITDKASAVEIYKNESFGKQYEIEKTSIPNEPLYLDGLTKEMVELDKQEKLNNNKSNISQTTSTNKFSDDDVPF